MTETIRARGGCLCGGIRYEIRGELRPVLYCHCEQCRRISGHFVAASATRKEDLHMASQASLAWYRSSDKARRGFCRVCGASLFWYPDDDPHVSIMAGSIDPPTGLTALEHIYVEFMGDYYSLDDGLPRHAGEGRENSVPE